jgi:hypothetical protein
MDGEHPINSPNRNRNEGKQQMAHAPNKISEKWTKAGSLAWILLREIGSYR